MSLRIIFPNKRWVEVNFAWGRWKVITSWDCNQTWQKPKWNLKTQRVRCRMRLGKCNCKIGCDWENLCDDCKEGPK